MDKKFDKDTWYIAQLGKGSPGIQLKRPKHATKRVSGRSSRQTRLRVSKRKHAIQRFRGRRARTKETISRVYSPRYGEARVKSLQLGVASKPYATSQLPSKESTAIYAMEYDPKTNLLWITFWGYKQKYKGDKYVYYRVPQSIWDGLCEASSKGRFFYYHIRGKFNYSRVS